MARKYDNHGMSGTKIYRAWISMRARCNNPNDSAYHNYGGRGIRVCDRWNESFYDFATDMGEFPEGHELDRIDVNKGYEPGNCRWVTPKENLNNKRTSHRVEWQGKDLTVAQWAELLGLHQRTLFNRIGRGWSIERAMTEPANTKESRN